MKAHWENLRSELDQIKSKDLYRECKEFEGLDFCSNDYLGLARSKVLRDALALAMPENTTGSTASRLVKGHRKGMEDFETKFAEFVESESSLLVSTGYVANMGLLDTIADSQTFIFTDRLNHASILDGIRISGANKKYYNHLDLDHLESQLAKAVSEQSSARKKRIIVSETLFSMDGDVPNIKRLIEIKRKYDCILVLDEAHSFGVFGREGRGMIFESLTASEVSEIEYRVYTMGKSLGLEGGIIATSKIGREYLINRMRAFIFSTAPLPIISITALSALKLVQEAEKQRAHLKEISKCFRDGMIQAGFQIAPSTTHIIPVLMPSEAISLQYSKLLSEFGFDIRAIRPPTVPTSRLRVSLNALITLSEIESLLGAFKKIREKVSD